MLTNDSLIDMFKANNNTMGEIRNIMKTDQEAIIAMLCQQNLILIEIALRLTSAQSN